MTELEAHDAGIAHRRHWFTDERGVKRYCPGSGHLSDDALALKRWLESRGEPDVPEYESW